MNPSSSIDYKFSSSLSLRDGFLFCDDVKINDLQKDLHTLFGWNSSPFFVYSRNKILENINSYRVALDNSRISYKLGYSMKANYNPEIVRLAGQSGCMAIAVSGNEVSLAIQQGILPENIILNGNGKQLWEIELAVAQGCLINVDSAFDLANIIKVTEQLDKAVDILVRINPDINADVHPFLATGLAKSKFGIEDDQLFELLEIIQSKRLIQLIGLHCHLGSTIDNTFVFSECLEVMINLAAKVRKKGYTSLSLLNLGGGLGINYKQHEHRTKNIERSEDDGIRQLIEKVHADCKEDGDEICKLILLASSLPREFDRKKVVRLKELLSGHKHLLHDVPSIFPSINFQNDIPSTAELIASVGTKLLESGYQLILEPGRSLVGNAGTLITKVIGVKKNGNQRYIVIDGSMTEIIRPALYSAYHHIELTEPTMSSEQCLQKDTFDIVGPVCECGDFLGKNRVLYTPHEGCGLAIFDAGAYCSSMASNYNMRPRPIEVMVNGSSWRLIRSPETLENMLHTFLQ